MAPALLSQEYVRDSSSDNETHVSDRKVERSLPNGKQKTKKTSSKQAAPDSSQSNKQTSSQSSSDTAGDSDSSLPEPSAISQTSKRKPADGTPASQPSKKKSKQAKLPQRTQSVTYHPPAGYESLQPSSYSGAGFDRKKLQSSQIWHIVAPANVSLTTIKSLDIAAVLRGDTIMQHQGAEYNMHATFTPNLTLLLPTNSDDDSNVEYQHSKTNISRSFHLRELTQVKLPKQSQQKELQAPLASQAGEMGKAVDLDGHNIKFTAVRPGSRKQPRQQPKGLIKRYHPYGSTVTGKEKMSNPQKDDQPEESEENSSTFILPPSPPMQLDHSSEIGTPKKHKQNKNHKTTISGIQQQESTGDNTVMESPEKRKKKKEKKDKAS